MAGSVRLIPEMAHEPRTEEDRLCRSTHPKLSICLQRVPGFSLLIENRYELTLTEEVRAPPDSRLTANMGCARDFHVQRTCVHFRVKKVTFSSLDKFQQELGARFFVL